MMVRLEFEGGAHRPARALRVRARAGSGVAIVAEAGPHLPFAASSIDELFVGRAIAYRTDVAAALDELWRVGKAGALVHLTLPHASSTIATSRDARPRPLLTLNTFNHYDPRMKPADAPQTTFTVERARLRVAGQRGDDSGLALARGPFARIVEQLANGSRGSQYRFERWFAGLIGGFEEFDVVLAVVKEDGRAGRREAGAAERRGRSTGNGWMRGGEAADSPDSTPSHIEQPERLPAGPPGTGE
ncbi:MAG TPA: hypothetical protein VEZ14_07610 [Dehalococcoidia bacterium]|nr:hypothetical protein [Dehalococcoidia bacterium]